MKNSVQRERWSWFWIAAAGIVLFVMGVVGFGRYASIHNQPSTLLDELYLALQLLAMNSGAVPPPLPWELEVARFGIPLLTALAAIKAVLDLFQEQVRRFRLRTLQDHIVICGLSRKGFLLAERLNADGRLVVIIEKNEENDRLATCRMLGMYVLVGDATDPELLRKAGVARAAAVVAVCDDDGINLEIALRVKPLAEERQERPLTCLVHIGEPQLCSLIREKETHLDSHRFQLELFNTFENGARLLLRSFPAWEEGGPTGRPVAHLLVIGLGRLGENLVVQAARDWWNQPARGNNRLPVTIIDLTATAKIESLCVRFPPLEKACDLHALDMDVTSADFARGSYLLERDGRPPVSRVYICMDDDARALQISLALLRQTQGRLPVVLRVAEPTGLASLLDPGLNHSDGYGSIHAFALLDTICTPELLTSTRRELLAQAAHADYVAGQRKAGANMDNPALQPWERLNENLRQNNYAFVDRLQGELASAGYGIQPLVDWDAPSMQIPEEKVELMAHMEHAAWCEQRLSEGWRFSPGPKNIESRTHPGLVDWGELAEEEREKNRNFVRNTPRFLGRIGLQIGISEIDI